MFVFEYSNIRKFENTKTTNENVKDLINKIIGARVESKEKQGSISDLISNRFKVFNSGRAPQAVAKLR